MQWLVYNGPKTKSTWGGDWRELFCDLTGGEPGSTEALFCDSGSVVLACEYIMPNETNLKYTQIHGASLGVPAQSPDARAEFQLYAMNPCMAFGGLMVY